MNTPKITTLEELRALSQDSPVGLLIESLISQNFVPTSQVPLTEKDTVIGTLTQMEKALHDANLSLGNSTPEFLKKLEEISQEVKVIEHRGGNTIALQEKMDKLRNEVDYAGKVSHDLTQLYWSFIRQRLCNEGIYDIMSLGIRANDTIVIPEKKADERSGRIMTIRIGS